MAAPTAPVPTTAAPTTPDDGIDISAMPAPPAGASPAQTTLAPVTPTATSMPTDTTDNTDISAMPVPPATPSYRDAIPHPVSDAINHFFIGGAETGLAWGSGMLSPLAGGLTYLGVLGATRDPAAATAVQQATEDGLTYTPKTPMGKVMANSPAEYLAFMHDEGQDARQYVAAVNQKFGTHIVVPVSASLYLTAQRLATSPATYQAIGQYFRQRFGDDWADGVETAGKMGGALLMNLPGADLARGMVRGAVERGAAFEGASRAMADKTAQTVGETPAPPAAPTPQATAESAKTAAEAAPQPEDEPAGQQQPPSPAPAAPASAPQPDNVFLRKQAGAVPGEEPVPATEPAMLKPQAGGPSRPVPPAGQEPPQAAPGGAESTPPLKPGAPATPAQGFLQSLQEGSTQHPTEPTYRKLNGNVSVEAAADPFDPAKVHIERLIADQPGKGQGNAAMTQMAQWADEHGVTLKLVSHALEDQATPIPQPKLNQFYMAHGFQPEEGGSLLGGGMEMERPPMGADVTAGPLHGMPQNGVVNGKPVLYGPTQMARTAAYNYTREAGIPYDPPRTYEPITPSRGQAIAAAYDAMPHEPNALATKNAYAALIRETVAQWKAIKRTGLKIDFMHPGQADPYLGSPRLATMDVRNNNHLWVYPTDSGFGSPMVNVGLKVGENGVISADQALAELQKHAEVTQHSVHTSNTEPTLVASLKRPLTSEEAASVAKNLHQESIAQHVPGGKSDLYGPKAEAWRPFNPDYFLNHEGKPLTAVADHPMLQPTNIVHNGRRLLANDVFRVVHDYFGHVKEGNGFRADGEFNAYRIHKPMYSPEARKALATETLGQNAWVNYGPHGEANRTASAAKTVYADQKAGLLPPEIIKVADVPAADWVNRVHAVPKPAGISAEPVKSRFTLPSAEGAVTQAVGPMSQDANAALLQRALPDLKEARTSALTRNYAESGSDFQTAKLDDALGKRAKGVIEGEQNAMREAVTKMGNGTDTSPAATEARSEPVADAIDSAVQSLRDWDDKLYAAGDAVARNHPANPAPFLKFMQDQKSNFYRTPEGVQMWKGLMMRAKELQLVPDETGKIGAQNAIALEDLRKYVSGPAHMNVKQLIGQTKDAIDDSLIASTGDNSYKAARANRSFRGTNFERNDAISSYLPPEKGEPETNRGIQIPRIMGRLTSASTTAGQLQNILDTLKRTRTYLDTTVGDHAAADALQGKIKNVYQSLRDEFSAQALRQGQKIERGWDQKSFAQFLQQNEQKMAAVFNEPTMQRWQDLNDAGNLLKMDRSYPGANAQMVNNNTLRQIGGRVAEGALTGALGPIGGALSDAFNVGSHVRGVLGGNPEKTAVKAYEASRITNLEKYQPKVPTPPTGGTTSIPMPGLQGGFEAVRQPTLGQRIGGAKQRGGPKAPAGPAVQSLLTDEERAGLRADTSKRLVQAFHDLPPTQEFAAAALAGGAARGWYRRSAEAIANVFGPDAPRFSALLAAMSPQSSVQTNFANAVKTFINWDKVGRPTDPAKIRQIMKDSSVGLLGAWIPNSIKALTDANPEKLTLSGPKVNSFMHNLRDNVHEVTNDSWMAAFSNVLPAKLAGKLSTVGPGKSPTYLAMSAKVREAAKMITHLTGETWTPREVQETIWSWAKTAYEHADSFGGLATIPELVKHGEISDELIRSAPDFHQLFSSDQHGGFVRSSRYRANVEQLAGAKNESPQSANTSQARAAAQKALRPNLNRAAQRLEQLRQSGGADVVANRARLGNALQQAGLRGRLNGDIE